MTAPNIHTDPDTGEQFLWNEQMQVWQRIAPAPVDATDHLGAGGRVTSYGYGGPGGSDSPPPVFVSETRKRTSHGLHLFLTIVTGGLWGLFVWLPITLWHKLGPRARTVTRQA